ncbi:MAG TPA: DUF4344 domain-containing metallopeptidase [Xanthobacteraceae bacterium]|jgi:hypothetical protein
MSYGRDLSVGLMTGALLLVGGAACGQPTQTGSPAFETRVKEVARALKGNRYLRNLSERQRMDRVEFVISNTLFVLLHEVAHVMVDEMNLPVLGREEDAADTFAALTMLKMGTSFSQRVLAHASKGWFLSDRRDRETGAEPIYYGEHNLSQQRAYRIVCLMVGSDPGKFKSVADEIKMPQSRQESCKEDYAQASRSWDMVLKPHRRALDQPETKINVAYSDAEGDFELFARSFRSVQLLEAVAERAATDFTWPAPFTIEMGSCGRPEAAWAEKTRTIRVCYELAFDLAQLHLAYVPGAPTTNPKRKRK